MGGAGSGRKAAKAAKQPRGGKKPWVEGSEGIGAKKTIRRGSDGKNNAEGKGRRSAASKKGISTRSVKKLLRADAKIRKALGETRDKRGNRAIGGKYDDGDHYREG